MIPGRRDPGAFRRGNVATATPRNHHRPVTTAVTRTTGSTATACATSSHSPGSNAVAAAFGLGRWPAPPVQGTGERTLAIRHRSTLADHRASARASDTNPDPPGTSKPTPPAHSPPITSSRPIVAVTGAVSRYSDSTSVRRPTRNTTLAAGRHRPRTARGNDCAMAPRIITIQPVNLADGRWLTSAPPSPSPPNQQERQPGASVTEPLRVPDPLH